MGLYGNLSRYVLKTVKGFTHYHKVRRNTKVYDECGSLEKRKKTVLMRMNRKFLNWVRIVGCVFEGSHGRGRE